MYRLEAELRGNADNAVGRGRAAEAISMGDKKPKRVPGGVRDDTGGPGLSGRRLSALEHPTKLNSNRKQI